MSDPKPHVDASLIVTAADAIRALKDGLLWTLVNTRAGGPPDRALEDYVHQTQARNLAASIERAETKIKRTKNFGDHFTEHRASVVVLHPWEAEAIVAVLEAYAALDRRGQGLT